MNNIIRLYKLVRKLYARAKANPAKYAKFETQVKALINAKDDKELVSAMTSLAFIVKDIYRPAKKKRTVRKPKAKQLELPLTLEPEQPPISLYTDPKLNS